jgi:hypothetical protein
MKLELRIVGVILFLIFALSSAHSPTKIGKSIADAASVSDGFSLSNSARDAH